MDFAKDLAALTEQQADLLDLMLDDMACGSRMSLEPNVVVVRQGQSPLIVVHGSGGRCLFLHALARHLPNGLGLWGIEAVAGEAHANRAEPFGTYLAALRAAQPSGPYRLAGYSAGCVIAFEIAARLEEAGEAVESLVLIDPVAPPDGDTPPDDDRSALARLKRRFEIAALASITPLSPEYAFVAQVNRDLAVSAAGFRRRKLAAAIRIVHGTRGPYVSSPETLMAWTDLSARGTDCAAVDCDHFEIVREPYVADTGRLMTRWLDATPRDRA
ncbi:MAG: thioesterase domain-containing protein [Rhizomicrobium sp.]